MPLPKKLQDMQESNDQRAEQKRWVSEMVNLSGIVPCAKGQISMQNNQLSHTRCDRDQLFRNCFSNPFQRPRQARSAKWKYCAQCFWLERKSDCVQNKWKTKKEVPRINLLMTTCEDSWHFSLVKSITELPPSTLLSMIVFHGNIISHIFARQFPGNIGIISKLGHFLSVKNLSKHQQIY